MYKHRLAKSAAIATGLMLLFAVPGLNHAQSSSPSAAHASNSVSSASQGDSLADVFAELSYNDEQKKTLNKIRQETATYKDAVLKDGKLNEDQKNAMLSGYDRITNGWIYKALTPEQKRLVRQKLLAVERQIKGARRSNLFRRSRAAIETSVRPASS
jgi:hypothetical protein